MQFLVSIGLEDNGGSLDPQHSLGMITRFVLPSIEALVKHVETGTVVGGPVAGSVRFIFIAEAESSMALEALLTSLPFWSVMRVEVTPLVEFKGRAAYIKGRLEQVKQAQAAAK